MRSTGDDGSEHGQSDCRAAEAHVLCACDAGAASQTNENTAIHGAENAAARAGSEGTLSQAVWRGGLRHARYIGLAKTHLQSLLTATALNLVRILNWLLGVPIARTRRSHFRQLVSPQPVMG